MRSPRRCRHLQASSAARRRRHSRRRRPPRLRSLRHPSRRLRHPRRCRTPALSRSPPPRSPGSGGPPLPVRCALCPRGRPTCCDLRCSQRRCLRLWRFSYRRSGTPTRDPPRPSRRLHARPGHRRSPRGRRSRSELFGRITPPPGRVTSRPSESPPARRGAPAQQQRRSRNASPDRWRRGPRPGSFRPRAPATRVPSSQVSSRWPIDS